MSQLEPGDTVRWINDGVIGTVNRQLTHGMVIDWPDQPEAGLDYGCCGLIELVASPTSIE